MRSATKRSSSIPLTTSTIRPKTSVDTLYSQNSPGWCASGKRAMAATISARDLLAKKLLFLYSSSTADLRTFKGVAPNVNLVDLRVLDANGSGNDSDVIDAIQTAI